jgi:hypothetical protein
MFTWGLIVFVGLWLILRDFNPVTKAKLMDFGDRCNIIVVFNQGT